MVQNIVDIAPLIADERKAGEMIERLRWPNGVKCPHCDHEKVYETKGPNPKRKQWKCGGCRKKFSVTTGSIFEGSHIHLGKWIFAIYMMASSKKGISANQLKRELQITYKAAWFMCHRIRYAMSEEPLKGLLGGSGGIVEVDETYIGGKSHGKVGRGAPKKTPVVALIERGGRARSQRVDRVSGPVLKGLVRDNVAIESHVMTDSFASYRGLDKTFARHSTVDHSKEYARGIVHVNFAESYFSLLKRGIIGAFHHVSADHLDNYLNEFNFRWNMRDATDGDRMKAAIRGAEGKRMTYQEPVQQDIEN